ncbi:glycosyltransferase family 2 protein [Aliarcobacter butzleri]|uniref:Family 2 glycosyl transferase n=1 Tax=Aliarcobacter butzleri L352 TaxID=1447260 RepID=A0A837JA68_9BACT|nr:glycosyltransferase family 2 protein [Aliarcobacter butzleri]KLE03690.1 family 2 glycosyl transferase [Aliarcobacter butzleri L352]
MKMSIVIPVYGCCKSLINLYERLTKSISLITDNFEIIMINDSSPDSAWEVIKELAQKDDRVKGIKLSRNFGQHKAISAGLDYANGDWIIVMDCDLQDQPEEIIKLYNKVQEGYDIVFGKKIERKDRYFKRLGSKLFFKIYDYFTDSKVDSTVGNFSIISKKVLSSLTQMREQTKAYPLFVNWIGFRKAEVLIEHSERKEGKSSYDMKKLVNLAIDNIVSQSNKPLKLSIKFGFILSIFSLLYGSWLIFRYFMFSIPVEGWTSVMVSIYFIGGLLFANMGILGLYIGKIFDETKNRPIYIIQETTFDK